MQSQAFPNTNSAEFRPELLSRRGEFVAWGLSLVLAAAWLVLLVLGQPVFWGLPLLLAFISLAALGISLGNWMDRHTLIRLHTSGVEFENGLRHARLAWNEIRQVQVFPSGWGDKVRVVGEQVHFSFRTLGEVKLQGEVKGHMGFTEGQKVLQHILEKANLKQIEQSGSGYYYARE